MISRILGEEGIYKLITIGQGTSVVSDNKTVRFSLDLHQFRKEIENEDNKNILDTFGEWLKNENNKTNIQDLEKNWIL